MATPNESLFGGPIEQEDLDQTSPPEKHNCDDFDSNEILRVASTINPPEIYTRSGQRWEENSARAFSHPLSPSSAANMFMPAQFPTGLADQHISLGTLSVIPRELIYKIVDELDIRSTIGFRHVNRSAKYFVESSINYAMILQHAPVPFLALLKANLPLRHSMSDLAAALCRDKCDVCSTEYGTNLFLPNHIRCCIKCLRNGDSEMFTVDPGATNPPANIPENGMVFLPALPNQNPAFPAGCRMGLEIQDFARLLDRIRATVPIPHLDAKTKTPQPPIYCKGCIETANTWLAMASVSEHDILPHYHPRYLAVKPLSEDMFLEHFKNCLEAQKIWSASRAGSQPVRKGGDLIAGEDS